jgi:hypothetical protein
MLPLLLPSWPLGAQPAMPSIVRESAAAYAAAPTLSLQRVRSWCEDPNAAGCDVRFFASAQLLPDGGVVASDLEPPVRRFSASGARLPDIARRGSGPGELRNVIAMRLLGADSVLLFGNMEMRLVRAALDGRGGRSETIVPPLTVQDMGFLGTQLVAWTAGRVASAGEEATGALREVFADTTRNRTRFTFVLPSQHEVGSGEFVRPITPLAPVTRTAVGAGGDAAYTSAANYTVHVVPAAGRPWTLRVDRAPRAVTRAERDSVQRTVRDRAQRLARDPRLKGAAAQAEEGLRRLPTRHAAITGLVVLRDGSCWVRTMPDAEASRVRWDGFTRDGARIGQLALQLQEQLLDGDATSLLIGRIDDAGVPSLTLYRVVRPSGK